MASTGAELAAKLSPKRLPEIRDRALKALGSKMELGLVTPEVALEIPGLTQLILMWLNDRQDSESRLVNVALKMLGCLARSADPTRLHEAGVVNFLQDFRPQVPPNCLETLDATLWALLCQPQMEGKKQVELLQTPPKVPREGAVQVTVTPAKTVKRAELTMLPEEFELTEKDQQRMLDLAVRLKYSEPSERGAAWRDVRLMLLDLPAAAVLCHGPLLEGLCLALRDDEAERTLCLLLDLFEEHRQLGLYTQKEDTLGLRHLLAQVLDLGDSQPLLLRRLQKLLDLPGEPRAIAQLREEQVKALEQLELVLRFDGGALQAGLPEEQLKALEQLNLVLCDGPVLNALCQLSKLVCRRLLSALGAILPSSEPQVLYTAELVLRVALALRRQGCEVECQDLSLIIQLVSLPAPLPLLALRLAMELTPTEEAHAAHVTSFGEVLLERLAFHSGRLQHSAELRAVLWLSDFAPPEAVAYVTPFLQHPDLLVAAAAWRSLRSLLSRLEATDEVAARRAAVQRGLRAWRAWEKQARGLALAEVLETLRFCLQAGCEPEMFFELLETLSVCFTSKHFALRRSACALLSALAPSPAAAAKIFEAGIWTSLLASVDAEMLGADELQVFTDVIQLVMQGTAVDSQILLWLCKSTALLRRWREVLGRLAGQRKTFSDLLGLQLRALHRFMEFDVEEPEFLFSTEVRDALFAALKATGETPDIALVVIAEWCRAGPPTQLLADHELGSTALERVLRSRGEVSAECIATCNLFLAGATASSDLIEELGSLLKELCKRCALSLRLLRVFFASLRRQQPACLTSVLLAVRSCADRDEAVCLEFLELLLPSAESLAEQLMDSELLSWLMQLTLKKIPSSAFCCAMQLLSLCSDVLAGRPALLRYLSQLMEVLSKLSKTSTSLRWRNKRLVAALHFLSSLRLCPRSAAILCGSCGAHEGTRRHLSAPLTAGLDLFFDLTGGLAGTSRDVRNAALRVLLALSEAMPKGSVDAWPRLPALLPRAEGRRMEPREGLLQLLAEEDVGAARALKML